MSTEPDPHTAFKLLEVSKLEDLLGNWFGEPMSPEQANQLLGATRQQRDVALRRGRSVFPHELAELISRFWLQDSPRRDDWIRGHSEPEQALFSLIRGQLLLSRRLTPAHQLLERGFNLAAPYLSAADYLAVFKRHNQLKQLPLGDKANEPKGLAESLAEARVIASLENANKKPRRGQPRPGDPADTVG
ncbi:MAG: hypothetical protein ACPG4N_05860 [Gammaproteobacteria bacterium]